MKTKNKTELSTGLSLVLFVIGVVIIFSYLSSVSSASTYRYENSYLTGVVDDIIGYSRGFPILSVNGKRTYIHNLPSDFTKYILPGDSITKFKGSYVVTSYRKNKNCLEIIIWKYSVINGFEQPDIKRKTTCK